MNRLSNLWQYLRSSLWFLPTVIVAGAAALAVALIEYEARGDFSFLAEDWPMLFGAGAAGARGLLQVIAGSMITVAGVTFSITVVTLALAASQYTSRILRNFMSDRANQAVLGVFMGVFTYSLVVLRTIRGGDEGAFVPALAVLGALLLALVAIGFYIYFIHHIASTIQASHVISQAAEETLNAIDRLFPSEMGESAEDAGAEVSGTDLAALSWIAIPAGATGYIQAVDPDALCE
ncbi:MAG: DUF2254 family protein, partial [Burkholderiaceae bacterium]